MNTRRRKEIAAIASKLNDLKDKLEAIRYEE